MPKASLRYLLQLAWAKRAQGWRRFALFLTRNEADADDLVDEAVARTLKADPDLKSEPAVHNYVLTAMRNTWSNWTRNRKHQRQLFDCLRQETRNQMVLPLQALIEAEEEHRIAEILDRALKKMEPEIRQVAVSYIRENEDFRLRRIAEIQGVSVTTAHERFKKALIIIGRELQSDR